MKHCPRCQHTHFVKNGFVNAKQRYKCKLCQYQWTRRTQRGKPQTHKTLALLLYCHGLSMNAISKLFGSHVTTVLKWIRTSAKKHAPKPTLPPGATVVLELDEMWRTLHRKQEKQTLDLEGTRQKHRTPYRLAMRRTQRTDPRKTNPSPRHLEGQDVLYRQVAGL